MSISTSALQLTGLVWLDQDVTVARLVQLA